MYVYQLAKELIEHGHDCLVLSLSNELISDEYDGIKIKYIPFEKDAFNDIEHPENLNALLEIVNEYAPNVFHLHTYTSSMGINHLLKIKELGIKVFFTSHLPNFTCLRGDLMKFGIEVCDGLVTKDKCMNCYLHSTGITNEWARKILISATSISIIRNSISRLNQYQAKVEILNTYKNTIDSIIVVSEWQKSLLILNGFNPESISVCRQSINRENKLKENKLHLNGKIKIGFIGRIVKVKGLHILLEALRNIDHAQFEINVVGIKSVNEMEYYNSVRTKASELGLNWIENLKSSEIFNFLDDIDLLVIPSIFLETGPIVAFEALARKVPVLTFNYGGTKELINEGNGYLINHSSEMEMVLQKILDNRSELYKKSDNIEYVRTSAELYTETINIYSKFN